MKFSSYLESVGSSTQQLGIGAFLGIAVCAYNQAHPESNYWTWKLAIMLVAAGLLLQWTGVLLARRNRTSSQKSAS